MSLRETFITLPRDLFAGTVVFLVAMPLCLGIANASGVEPFAGLLSGIVGGLVVALLSGSQLSVSGPAAGLVLRPASRTDGSAHDHKQRYGDTGFSDLRRGRMEPPECRREHI